MTWTPTPDNINALDEPVRRYIHDLETRCDKAGEVATIHSQREQIAGLTRAIRALEARNADLEGEWLPIETAKPVEFVTQALLCREGKPHSMPGFWDGEKWRCFSLAGPMVYQDPTHWRPLPAPPSAEQKR